MSPPRYDLPKAAPPPLRLVQLFVNSVDLEHGVEWLAGPEELAAWLTEHETPPDEPVSADEVLHARQVRDALRGLLAANNGAELPRADVETLDEAARRARLTFDFADPRRPELRLGARGVDGAIGRILAVVFAAAADGTLGRLKACRNCRWAFYDYSKNHSATWCSMAICGNRLKTRAYRRRRARPAAA
jgi:predicted RNA-binding Zn ribbon-like protein